MDNVLHDRVMYAAARLLKENCNGRKCFDCCFNDYGRCVLSESVPDLWPLDEIKIGGVKNDN